jgi:preprotein translocase SecE subunit
VAKNMADRKKSATRSQTTELKTREKRVTTEKSVKTTPASASTEKGTSVSSTREARREPVKQEAKTATRREPVKQDTKNAARRETKAPSTFTRLRNSKAGRFIYDAYYELRYKVTWPTFEEAKNMAFLVVIISAVLGLLIAGTDFGLYRLFTLITTGK